MLYSSIPSNVPNLATSILATGSKDAYVQAAKTRDTSLLDMVREEGDTDLICACVDVLKESGLGQKIDIFLDNHNIISGIKLKPEAQRFLLNQYWRVQLMSAPVSSTNERFNLIDTGTPSDWLRLFKQFIIPFIVEHDLPKVI
jgi:hypothetical protein